jgi:magnesium-transporting ATPase (P-type)
MYVCMYINQNVCMYVLSCWIRFITALSVVMGLIVFIVALAKGWDPLYSFINGFIIIVVANVPQGLPVTVTSCLSIVATRMIAQNVYVKKLDTIETLGSVSVICSDKTGTLTQNRMTVRHTYFNGKVLTAEDVVSDDLSTLFANTPFRTLTHVATLNSRVEVRPANNEVGKEVHGDATELGIYQYMQDIHENIEGYREKFPKLLEIPFNSANKWQLSVHEGLAPFDGVVMLLKGAPEIVLEKCSTYLNPNGEIVSIDESFKKQIGEVYEELGGFGERVLGFCIRKVRYRNDV